MNVNDTNKNNKKQLFNQSTGQLNSAGFSLIEILLSLVILFLIIGGMVGFSARTIESHTKNQAMQNAMDNARFAIEGMSKKIRTSSEITGGGGEVFFKDNVDGSKYCYQFGTNSDGEEVLQAKRYEYVEGDSDYDSIIECDDFPVISEFEDLVGGANLSVDGEFQVKATDADFNQRGFVRMRVDIEYDVVGNDNVLEKDSVTIQSGVSLRDY